MKATQYLSDEYLDHTRKLKPEAILKFLEEFRLMHAGPDRSKLISIKMPERMLRLFRDRCLMLDIPYQTQIKKLMQTWLEFSDI